MNPQLPPVVHIVFFWLKRPDSGEDLDTLVRGLRKFGEIEEVRGIHVGVPDETKQRAVVDSTYSASIVLCFDDRAGFDAHIAHPVHDEFARDCGHLFERVVVYDPKPVLGL